MTDETKEAVDRLRAVPVGHNDSDAEVYDAIQTVITALESATARAERAEKALRVYAEEVGISIGLWNAEMGQKVSQLGGELSHLHEAFEFVIRQARIIADNPEGSFVKTVAEAIERKCRESMDGAGQTANGGVSDAKG